LRGRLELNRLEGRPAPCAAGNWRLRRLPSAPVVDELAGPSRARSGNGRWPSERKRTKKLEALADASRLRLEEKEKRYEELEQQLTSRLTELDEKEHQLDRREASLLADHELREQRLEAREHGGRRPRRAPESAARHTCIHTWASYRTSSRTRTIGGQSSSARMRRHRPA